MPREKDRIQIPIGIIMESSSGKREARISDLSMSGCFIDSIANVREGEIIRFKLSLAQGDTENLSGEVAYILEGIGFGIKFTGLSDEQQIIIDRLVLANGGKA